MLIPFGEHVFPNPCRPLTLSLMACEPSVIPLAEGFFLCNGMLHNH